MTIEISKITRQIVLLLLLLGSSIYQLQAQKNAEPIQFSGLVLTEENKELAPVPYATVQIKKKGKGTYANAEGFFSIVAERGDKVTFSAVGFETVVFIIPDTLKDDRYSIVQLLAQDTILLAETIIFPWPSKEHFRLEFLAMDVEDELQKRARENLTADALEKASTAVRVDGNESGDFYLRQQAKTYYYNGQVPPMNIFNPMAWKDFFDAWKSGKFKKKKKGT